MLVALSLLGWTSAAAQTVHVVGPGGLPDLATALEIAVDGDVIELEPGVWEADIDFIHRELTIRSTGGAAVTTLTGGGGNVMASHHASVVTYEGVTFDPAFARRAMYVNTYETVPSAVTLRDVVFEGATVLDADPYYFAGPSLLVANGSTVILEGATFGTSDPNGRYGGHVGVVGGSTLIATDTVFEGATTGHAGALYLDDSTVDLTRCSFVGGTAAGLVAYSVEYSSGGALYSYQGDVTLTDTTFDGATAAWLGGGAYIYGGSATMTGGGFFGNVADYGGGLFCDAGAVCTITDAGFEGNDAEVHGGGLAMWPEVVGTLTRARVCDNHAGWHGGGLLVLDAGVTVTSSTFCGNTADGLYSLGGAAAAGSVYGLPTSLVSRNNSYVDNFASLNGGALSTWIGTIGSTSDLFVGNATAGVGTAADQVETGVLSVSHALFFDNPTGDANVPLDATTLVGVDPLLAAYVPGDCAASDLHPTWGSPVIDAGDPAYTDPDGTIADIGAYGGPDADPAFFVDADGDTVRDAWDCAPADPTRHPLAAEVCDGVDQDCDDVAEDDALDAVATFPDADGDGFGDATGEALGCVVAGLADNGDDCDDGDGDAFPGAPEVPGDGVDQDCDGADATVPPGTDTAEPTTGPGTDTAEPTEPGTGPTTDSTAPTTDTDTEREPPSTDTGDAVDDPTTKPGGCACDAAGPPAPTWLAGLVALLAVTRRRRR